MINPPGFNGSPGNLWNNVSIDDMDTSSTVSVYGATRLTIATQIGTDAAPEWAIEVSMDGINWYATGLAVSATQNYTLAFYPNQSQMFPSPVKYIRLKQNSGDAIDNAVASVYFAP